MAEVLAGSAEETKTEAPERPVKDLYEVGEIPPLGHVPSKMHAWVIRRERHGEPEQAMQIEVVDTPALDSHDVLVMVMASLNRNIWTKWYSSSKNTLLMNLPRVIFSGKRTI